MLLICFVTAFSSAKLLGLLLTSCFLSNPARINPERLGLKTWLGYQSHQSLKKKLSRKIFMLETHIHSSHVICCGKKWAAGIRSCYGGFNNYSKFVFHYLWWKCDQFRFWIVHFLRRIATPDKNISWMQGKFIDVHGIYFTQKLVFCWLNDPFKKKRASSNIISLGLNVEISSTLQRSHQGKFIMRQEIDFLQLLTDFLFIQERWKRFPQWFLSRSITNFVLLRPKTNTDLRIVSQIFFLFMLFFKFFTAVVRSRPFCLIFAKFLKEENLLTYLLLPFFIGFFKFSLGSQVSVSSLNVGTHNKREVLCYPYQKFTFQ